MVKRIAKILLWGVIGLYVPVILGFMSINRQNSMCQGIDVCVNDSSDLRFVTPNEIRNHVLRYKKGIARLPIKEINLEQVEQLVAKYPSVASSDAYFTPEGKLRIVVFQRTPVLRVFEQGGSYLLDREGVKIPLRGSYRKRLLVVSGNVSKLKDKKELVALNDFVLDDSFWRAQIEQVFVAANGDIMVVPRVGDHLINLGDASDLDYKFRNLLALYRKGFQPLEWNSYKMINLKYKGQVICSKI